MKSKDTVIAEYLKKIESLFPEVELYQSNAIQQILELCFASGQTQQMREELEGRFIDIAD